MRMNMSDFATFFAVARNQSFRAAGDELGLSSSAISHSIKTLEQRLKIRLFNRTTRSVSLTEAGSNLYEQLRPAFDEIQIMLDEMNDFRLTPTGTLKINAARVAARIFLMPLLVGLKWFTEFGHLNRGDMLTSEQHRCHNEKKKFQRRV
ncbi:hypothetical protein BE1S17E07_27270 [Escherichia coli]|nr:hypothetical protein BE1S17E07_27270 [Escherichia coli]